MVDRIGILAVQGNVKNHDRVSRRHGVDTRAVKCPSDLGSCSHLLIPGGESSVFLHLLDESFREEIRLFSKEYPVFGTCAGLILMAKDVKEPEQESLSLLDIEVCRNGFGRHSASFIAKDLVFEPDQVNLEGVFIRAPRITRCLSEEVEVLVRFQEEAVMVRQGLCLGSSFHPELSPSGDRIFQYFLSLGMSTSPSALCVN